MERTAQLEKPLRLTVRMAADRLAVSPQTVLNLIRSEVLKPITPNGRGSGRRLYLDPNEIDVYATGGLEGVVAFRKKQRGKTK